MNERIYKFRAWDIATKKMYKVDELKNLWEYLGSGGLNYPIAIIQKTRGKDYEINIAKEGNELMQYTGLKDKNGKGSCIYENDFVDLQGNIKGNLYENPEMVKDATYLLIQGFGTKDWITTYKEAVGRGCNDAK